MNLCEQRMQLAIAGSTVTANGVTWPASGGISNFAPHLLHFPRLPAKFSLTLNVLPQFGQVTEIVMLSALQQQFAMRNISQISEEYGIVQQNTDACQPRIPVAGSSRFSRWG